MAKKKNSKKTEQDLEIIEEDDLEEKDQLECENDPISQLNKEVESLKDELAVERNKFLKAHADLENTKRRLTNDFAKRNKYLIQDFALSLLPALDNMEQVLSKSDDKDNSLIQAIEMIYRQLKTSLEDEGVQEIDALDQKFDPNFHHAVLMEAVDGVESDKVVEVLQKGYKLKDRVLRASMVKVSE